MTCRSCVVPLLIAAAVTSAGCTVSPSPPLLIESRQPVQLPREEAYVACATELFAQYPARNQLRLQQRYQMYPVRDDDNVRVLVLHGWIMEDGRRHDAQFRCTASRFGSTRVLALERFDPAVLAVLRAPR